MVKPSLRREMAQKAVTTARCSIRQACEAFSVSESCYRYRAKLSSENAEIADLLVRLAHTQLNAIYLSSYREANKGTNAELKTRIQFAYKRAAPLIATATETLSI
jgi:putative transposase